MSSKNPEVAVLGLGAWGTALAHHLSSNGVNVLGWTKYAIEASSINSFKHHPRLFPETQVNFKATTEVEDVKACKLIVLAVPSKALEEVLQLFASILPEKQIVSVIKGFHPDSHKTPLQCVQELGVDKNKLAVLSGPSFAADIILGKPCGIVAASTNLEMAGLVAKTFSAASMRVYTSTDPLGVEIGGSLKNVIAVASGISDGLQLGDSARAGVITRGLAEIVRIGTALGAQRDTFYGLSGVGDLTMTASSPISRNYQVGLRLGGGEPLPTILKSLTSVSEGVFAAPIAKQIALEHGLSAPISEAVCKIIEGEVAVEDVLQELMMRPLKEE